MRFYVALTDERWFAFLRERRPEEVNFWRPGTTPSKLQAGTQFLFKAHSRGGRPGPIIGGGTFVRYSRLPVSLAWSAFREMNGTESLAHLRTLISKYRSASIGPGEDPDIGCMILAEPFFLRDRDFVPAPADWAPNIVQGKGYDTTDPTGQALWQNVVQARAGSVRVASVRAEYDVAFGTPYLQQARLGQGAFRILTLENYDRRCSITGETTLPVLQTAHIVPVADGGQHALDNGLLLRADLHILFDQGLVGITPDYRVQISRQIKDNYLNGRVYYAHHGHLLRSLPSDEALRPAPEYLERHMDERFLR
jgi:putative restriction endonuclease